MKQTDLLRRLLHYVRPYGLLLAGALGFALLQREGHDLHVAVPRDPRREERETLRRNRR